MKNCRICGKVFLYFRSPAVCDSCREKLDEIYGRAREELRKTQGNGTFNSIKLAETLDVAPVYIQILVEEGVFDREEFMEEENSGKRYLARQFAAELKKMQSIEGETGNPFGKMFIEERRGES